MTTSLASGMQSFSRHWLSAAASLLACQWKVFEFQYKAGLKVVEAALGGTRVDAPASAPPTTPPIALATAPPAPPVVTPAPAAQPAVLDVRQLERRAAERISLGLAPPREIYKAPYRSQIDWEKFPVWARPSDPEMFTGSAHEG